jgi:hypothetical protein
MNGIAIAAENVRRLIPLVNAAQKRMYIWGSNGGSLGLVWLRRSVVDLLFFYPYFSE